MEYVTFLVTVVVVACSVWDVVEVSADKPPWGEPLFLSPLIKAGNLTEARTKSKNDPLKGNILSYSGFLTVDNRWNSNVFFWYFPAETKPLTAPVILWLQGGPGKSSLSGVFEENGPFYIKKHRGMKMKRHYWSQVAHMIYIDSPVGTGFSFTDKTDGYARDQNVIVNNLYDALVQYFMLFRECLNNDFYIVGESYGANSAVMLAKRIHLLNPRAVLKMNLKGIALQNALYDPKNIISYKDYLYQTGIIDLKDMDPIKNKENQIFDLLNQKKFLEAFKVFDSLIVGDLSRQKTLFNNLTFFESYNNFLYNNNDYLFGKYEDYLKKDLVRLALHVGNLTFTKDHKVELYLVHDIMTSVKSALEELLEMYKVLVYVGQMNIIVNYPMTEYALQKLRWSGALQYSKQPRKVWRVGDDIAGYVKTVKNFTEILVRNAGNKVAYDQPLWSLTMIKNFVYGQPFTVPIVGN